MSRADNDSVKYSKEKVIPLDTIKYNMKRREIKFLMTETQYERLLPLLRAHTQPDSYGTYAVSNIYYDTEDFAIIRTCLDHPAYKEKFRIRSYGVPTPDTTVFAEIKKKYKGVTYKRRVSLPLWAVPEFLSGKYDPAENGQITNEIRWFLDRAHPSPKVFIGYDREAYEGTGNAYFRVTFDRALRWRTERLDLTAGDDGAPLLSPDTVLVEVKTPDTIPLWLCRFLSDEGIYRTGFSKYGVCYEQVILPTIKERKDALC